MEKRNYIKFNELILIDILMFVRFSNNDDIKFFSSLINSKYLYLNIGDNSVGIGFKNEQIPKNSTEEAFDTFVEFLGQKAILFLKENREILKIEVYIENSINFFINYKKECLKLSKRKKTFFDNIKFNRIDNYSYYYFESTLNRIKIKESVILIKHKCYLKLALFDYNNLTKSLCSLQKLICFYNESSDLEKLELMCLINTYYLGFIIYCMREYNISDKALFTVTDLNNNYLFSHLYKSIDDFVFNFIKNVNSFNEKEYIVKIDLFEHFLYSSIYAFELSESKLLKDLDKYNIKLHFRFNYNSYFTKIIKDKKIDLTIGKNFKIYELNESTEFINEILRWNKLNISEDEIILRAAYLILLIKKNSNQVAKKEILHINKKTSIRA